MKDFLNFIYEYRYNIVVLVIAYMCGTLIGELLGGLVVFTMDSLLDVLQKFLNSANL